MNTVIHKKVEQAQKGENPYVITKVKSGWVVIGEVQPTKGYCLLLPDPVVENLNSLTTEQRNQYTSDMIMIGDALTELTDCWRINYEMLGNVEPALHAHVIPRYITEDEDKRKASVFCAYDWTQSRKTDLNEDNEFIQKMKAWFDKNYQ